MKSQTTVFKNNHNEILMDCFMYPTLEVLSISYVSQLTSESLFPCLTSMVL